MQYPVPDFVADRVAAQPTFLFFQEIDVVLVEDNHLPLREELSQDPTATIVDNGLPCKAEPEVVDEAFDVKTRHKAMPLPELRGPSLDPLLGDERHCDPLSLL